jgi:hypothetical protein
VIGQLFAALYPAGMTVAFTFLATVDWLRCDREEH